MPTFNCLKTNKGFSLLEMILAVGILSAVVGAIVGLQTSIFTVSAASGERMKADWALRSAISQLKYALETGGIESLAEDTQVPWSADNKFVIEIKKESLIDLKPSQFLIAALSVYNSTSSLGNEHLNVEQLIAPLENILNKVPANPTGTDPFQKVTLTVRWKNGLQNKKLEETFYVIDNSVLNNVTLPLPGVQSNPPPPNSGGKPQ